MKTYAILLLSLLIAACGQRPQSKAAAEEVHPDGVEVLSFHTKRRCPTCLAIERLTREVVESRFAPQLADGSLTLRVVEIEEEEALADRYEVSWSSLLLNRFRDGAQTTSDLTQFAFANARTQPDRFKAELAARIEKMLAE